jgi:hypothetical protein
MFCEADFRVTTHSDDPSPLFVWVFFQEMEDSGREL